jgi:cell fate (sporulation/competence/biofilm development) regulator YlbF (YheA/YmcA/DUF963 family)
MKSIIVKPNFIEVGDKEVIIRITDDKEVQFIKTHLNNTLGFHINTLENLFQEKKETMTIEANNETKNITIPFGQIESYYKEYQEFSLEKQTILLKLKEVQKQMEHSQQMNSFNEFCSNIFNVKMVSHLCKYCKINQYPTIKSLSAHQRKCKLINSVNVLPNTNINTINETTCEEIEEE